MDKKDSSFLESISWVLDTSKMSSSIKWLERAIGLDCVDDIRAAVNLIISELKLEQDKINQIRMDIEREIENIFLQKHKEYLDVNTGFYNQEYFTLLSRDSRNKLKWHSLIRINISRIASFKDYWESFLNNIVKVVSIILKKFFIPKADKNFDIKFFILDNYEFSILTNMPNDLVELAILEIKKFLQWKNYKALNKPNQDDIFIDLWIDTRRL